MSDSLYTPLTLKAFLVSPVELVAYQFLVNLRSLYLNSPEEFVQILKECPNLTSILLNTPDASGIRFSTHFLMEAFYGNSKVDAICVGLEIKKVNQGALHALVESISLFSREKEFILPDEFELLKKAVSKVGDINFLDKKGDTLLHCSLGQPKIVQLLLEKRINPNALDLDGNTAFQLALYRGIFCIELATQENINHINHLGETALTIICGENERDKLYDILNDLSTKGIKMDLNQQDLLGRTALLFCIQNGYQDAMLNLLDYEEVNIQTCNYSGLNALLVAVFYNQKEILEYLIEKVYSKEALETILLNKLPTGASIFALVHDKEIEEILTSNFQKVVERSPSFFTPSNTPIQFLKKQKDIYEIESAEWGMGKIDIGLFLLNKGLIKNHQLKINQILENKDLEFEKLFFLVQNFQDVYFINPTHKLHYEKDLLDEITQLIPLLEIPLVQLFFEKNLDLLNEQAKKGQPLPTFVIPWGPDVYAFNHPRRPPDFDYSTQASYSRKHKYAYLCMEPEEGDKKIANLLHEYIHRLINFYPVNLFDFENHYQKIKSNLLKYKSNSSADIYKIQLMNCIPNDDETIEEFVTRAFEIVFAYGQGGINWLEFLSPGIEKTMTFMLKNIKKSEFLPGSKMSIQFLV